MRQKQRTENSGNQLRLPTISIGLCDVQFLSRLAVGASFGRYARLWLRYRMVGTRSAKPGSDAWPGCPLETLVLCHLCVCPRLSPVLARHGPARDLRRPSLGSDSGSTGPGADRARDGDDCRSGDLAHDGRPIRGLVHGQSDRWGGDGRGSLHTHLRVLCGRRWALGGGEAGGPGRVDNQRLQAQGQAQVDMAKARGAAGIMSMQERREEAQLDRLQGQIDLAQQQRAAGSGIAAASGASALGGLASLMKPIAADLRRNPVIETNLPVDPGITSGTISDPGGGSVVEVDPSGSVFSDDLSGVFGSQITGMPGGGG